MPKKQTRLQTTLRYVLYASVGALAIFLLSVVATSIT
jgi:hypothetical protein